MRDAATAAALGASVRLVLTVLTEQSSAGVRSVAPRPSAQVAADLAAALPDAAAVKVGLVGGPDQTLALMRALEGYTGSVVVDPVLRASSGGRLFMGQAGDLMALARRATLVTPNLDEAGALLGDTVRTARDAVRAAEALVAVGLAAVLVKGGHLAGEPVDALAVAGQPVRLYRSQRVGPARGPRGTGCALATATAVALGRGRPLAEAVAEARAWLVARIARAVDLGDETHLPPD